MKEFLIFSGIVLGLMIALPMLPLAIIVLTLATALIIQWFMLTADNVHIDIHDDSKK